MDRFKTFWHNVNTRIRLAWIKYWTLQRKGHWDWTAVSFRRALGLFVTFLLAVYFVIGVPLFGYFVYVKKSDGLPLAIAATLYPFPVATVGGNVILLKPYYDRLTYIRFFNTRTNQPVPQGQDLRNQVINKLIDESVTRTWANKAGITVSNQDINASYQQIIKSAGGQSQVKTVLAQLYNLSESQFKLLIPDQLYQEKIEDKIIERVHVKHILLATQDDANKVRAQVTTDNFDALAKQYSEDKTTRDSGGDLGFFDIQTATTLDPALEQAFFSTPVGQISQPVKSTYGYDIVYVVEKTGTDPVSFTQWLVDKRSQTKVYRFLN